MPRQRFGHQKNDGFRIAQKSPLWSRQHADAQKISHRSLQLTGVSQISLRSLQHAGAKNLSHESPAHWCKISKKQESGLPVNRPRQKECLCERTTCSLRDTLFGTISADVSCSV